ncbi:MAG TPA: hypothetical protein PLB11_03880 [Flavobacterium sp.]|nr:hypothetical protein [Flavobacterium sp.]
MKKITLIALLFCSFTILFAQAPQKMSYQSVIRKSDGSLVVNTSVGIKISILQGSANGTAAYVETQTTTTNANGLATLAIGGGTPVTGTFAGINWASGIYFIKTETDPAGGANYTITGTSQLLSVPYALYSGNSQNKGKTTIILIGNITDSEAAAQIAAEMGPYTESVLIQNTSVLTTVDLSAFTNLIDLDISGNTALTSVNVSGLKVIYRYLDIVDNKAICSLSFPVLTTIGGYDFDIYNNSNLTSINFPLLTNIKDINATYNSKLAFIGLPSLTSIINNYVGFNNNALPSSQINSILNKFLTITPATGKSVNLSNQTPPAPPTGQGIIDKQTLSNAGNSVSTD